MGLIGHRGGRGRKQISPRRLRDLIKSHCNLSKFISRCGRTGLELLLGANPFSARGDNGLLYGTRKITKHGGGYAVQIKISHLVCDWMKCTSLLGVVVFVPLLPSSTL